MSLFFIATIWIGVRNTGQPLPMNATVSAQEVQKQQCMHWTSAMTVNFIETLAADAGLNLNNT